MIKITPEIHDVIISTVMFAKMSKLSWQTVGGKLKIKKMHSLKMKVWLEWLNWLQKNSDEIKEHFKVTYRRN